jgi:glyoxylase-like metal-dependent hydrolase (beta-lactamase superfamily II)
VASEEARGSTILAPILQESKDMSTRRPSLPLLLLLALAACGSPDAETTDAAASEPSASAAIPAEIPADQLIRTADPGARGYTAADFPRVQELAPDVYSYEQLRSAGDEQFTTVSLFVVTDEGVLVADGQGSVDETQRMIDHIAEITDQPIRTVVIASDHGDHTAGNFAFPSDAEFIAHPTSAAALGATADAPDRPADAPPVVLPTRLVEEREVISMGDKEIEVLFLGRAHTGGDLVVYLPEEKILFMSETFLHRIFPAMRSAYPSEWVEMIERAQEMDVDTYVPGHGFVDAPSILEEELELFQGAIRIVIAEAERLHEEGYALTDAQQQAYFGDIEDWTLRSSQGDRALEQVYAEIEGALPGGGE